MNNYLITNNDTNCYGCRACQMSCPARAIEMLPNNEGFLYPVLDLSKCIKCNICETVCPFENSSGIIKNPTATFVCQNSNESDLMISSSGGVFLAVSRYILSINGYVCGCIFDSNMSAKHIITNEFSEIKKMCGSKYVQSDLTNTYPQIKDLLEKKQTVLFTGTPCQVAGLQCYLKKDYSNLFTMDLICHGVPSPMLLKAYLESCRGTVHELRFRDKQLNGWGPKGSITIEKKGRTCTERISPYNNSYYQMYYINNNVNRCSCYECQYAQQGRVGDISAGDFWNNSEHYNKHACEKGLSALMVNTEQGRLLIDNVDLVLMPIDYDSIAKGNPNLSKPNHKPESRDSFYSRLDELGYKKLSQEECKYSYFIPFVKRHIPRFVKKALKKVIK